MTAILSKLSTLAILVVLLVSCKEAEPPSIKVDGKKAYQLAKGLTEIGPRPSGSKNVEASVAFISSNMEAMGYTPEIDKWTEKGRQGEVTFQNVYARLPGKKRGMIVVGSHHDTKLLDDVPQFIGANDSASSTGLLLEIMRVLKEHGEWSGPTLLFAFFDGEECVFEYSRNDGLHGSKRLVQQLSEGQAIASVKAMVLLDMIGDRDLKLTISEDDDPKLIGKLVASVKALNMTEHFGYHKGSIHDDHVPFKQAGIPAIDIIDFDFGPNNSYWHTSDDSMDKISADSLQKVGDLTIHLLQRIQ